MVSKRKKFPVTEKAFISRYKNIMTQLKRDAKGLISYFNRETDLTVQPRKEFYITQIPLGKEQYESMQRIVKVGTKASNPLTKIKQNEKLLRIVSTYAGYRDNKFPCDEFLHRLPGLGPKIATMLGRIRNTKKEKHWIYCGLPSRGGITPVVKSLECSQFSRVPADKVRLDAKFLEGVIKKLDGKGKSGLPGKDYNRFVVLQRDTPKKIALFVLEILNHRANVDGKLIRLVVGDSSRKEGINLYSIKHVHILSPEPRYSDWHQAISRAIRYCSFKFVKSVRDWKVNVFTYLSEFKPSCPVYESERSQLCSDFYSKKGRKTLDAKLIKELKKQLYMDQDFRTQKESDENAGNLLPYVHAFKECAIDCYLNAKMHRDEEIKCYLKTPVVQKRKA
jgi:hypothetical protein